MGQAEWGAGTATACRRQGFLRPRGCCSGCPLSGSFTHDDNDEEDGKSPQPTVVLRGLSEMAHMTTWRWRRSALTTC